MMRFLVGIDDTDNLESRGTGFVGRTMAEQIVANGLGTTGAISRHQLLFDPRVPYTSHNSSLCIEVETNDKDELLNFMIKYLLKACAIGSDCGLCMIDADNIPSSVIDWGKTAKQDLVRQIDGLNLAKRENITLIGLTGNHDGVIGSMAAIGLRASGNDGRFVALKGTDVRTITGVKTLAELKALVEIDRAITLNGEIVDNSSSILMEGWLRPVHQEGLITLIVSKIDKNNGYGYKLADKECIKSISN
ncbi:MAG: hypothetical protein AB7S48_13590 [Bacteroidales bacterium]